MWKVRHQRYNGFWWRSVCLQENSHGSFNVIIGNEKKPDNKVKQHILIEEELTWNQAVQLMLLRKNKIDFICTNTVTVTSFPSMNLSHFLSNNILELQRPKRTCGDMRDLLSLFQSVLSTTSGDLDLCVQVSCGMVCMHVLCVPLRWDQRQIILPWCHNNLFLLYSSVVRLRSQS